MRRVTHGPRRPARGALARTYLAVLALSSIVLAPDAAAQGAPSVARRISLRDVIEMTLERSAGVVREEWAVRAQTGALLQSSATFDPHVRAGVTSDRAGTPLVSTTTSPASTKTETNFGYSAGADWLLRSGASISPSVSYSRLGASSTPGVSYNTGVAALALSMPLMRGRGGGFAVASERAAVTNLSASRAGLADVRAMSVRDAVNAYWGYVASLRTLDVLRESERRAAQLVQQTKTLISADERAAVDSISVAANLMAKRASRLASEDAVSAARLVLAIAMGLPADQLVTLGPAAEAFVTTPDSATVAAWADEATWVAHALTRRPDLSAARLRSVANQELARGARSEIRTQFDLTAAVGYTGIEIGSAFHNYFSPFQTPQRGFQTQLGFAYAVPLRNRAAEGQLERTTAVERQAALAVGELRRTIALDVTTSVETLRRTTEELRLSQGAVGLFTAAVDGEQEKFRLGTSTLFDVIIAEDNLTSARLALTNTQRRYATAIAQLRYATGSLGRSAGCDADALVRLATVVAACSE